MSTRNFDALFAPRAVALIGASNKPKSVGAVVARNLLAGGFAGGVHFVNPHESEIAGHPCVNSVAELPDGIDLAVLATPAPTIPGLVTELAEKGARAGVVITGGFGPELRQKLLDASRPHLMRIVGPNCIGFASPAIRLDATFAHLFPRRGRLALVSQSGAILTALIDWAESHGIGFSHTASLGDMADVDFGDMLDHLALDAETRAILIYVETITNARKFMSAARIAARAKPVIVIKSGRSEAGARAAASHTGALAGSDAVYDAAFRRAGMLRVGSVRDLFDAAETLSRGVRVSGDRLSILTNGGGLGVLAADAVSEEGVRLATLSEAALAELSAVLPPAWSHGNPIDIIGDAGAERYGAALRALAERREQDAVLVINCPTGIVDSRENAQAVVDVARAFPTLPVFTSWAGETTQAPAREILMQAAIPTYETPEEGVRAFARHVDYRRNQAALLETPRPRPPITEGAAEAAEAVFAAALAEGRDTLTEPEAKRVLKAYGVPILETREAKNPAEAAAVARELGGRVAIKILSPDITHKSDVGGVRLDLAPAEVEREAAAMLEHVQAKAPDARLTGFIVQAMIDRERALELLIGAHADATFGPVVVFGQGGVSVEVVADSAVSLAPLNSTLAEDMIERTRVWRLMQGYRDRKPVNLDAVVNTLLALSDIMVRHPRVVSVDINPLIADENGAIALDARVMVRETGQAPQERLAILPYPAGLETEAQTRAGEHIRLRPIRPEDEPHLIRFAGRCTPEALRLRFHGAVRALSHDLAARMSQIDYHREIAMLATEPEDDADFLGVGRLHFDPDFQFAEYAIIVRSDKQGLGIGQRLMEWLLDHARARGARSVVGDVLLENTPMLDLAQRLGGRATPSEQGVVRVTFALD